TSHRCCCSAQSRPTPRKGSRSGSTSSPRGRTRALSFPAEECARRRRTPVPRVDLAAVRPKAPTQSDPCTGVHAYCARDPLVEPKVLLMQGISRMARSLLICGVERLTTRNAARAPLREQRTREHGGQHMHEEGETDGIVSHQGSASGRVTWRALRRLRARRGNDRYRRYALG